MIVNQFIRSPVFYVAYVTILFLHASTAIRFFLFFFVVVFFFFQAEAGIRDFCLSRGLGDVYKRQGSRQTGSRQTEDRETEDRETGSRQTGSRSSVLNKSDAGDERTRGDHGGRRLIKKKKCLQLYLIDTPSVPMRASLNTSTMLTIASSEPKLPTLTNHQNPVLMGGT